MLGNLQEIFGAITAGLMTLLVLSTVPWIWNNAANENFLKFWKSAVHKDTLTPTVAALITPLVFGFGYIVQELTDHLTDSDFRSNYGVLKYQHEILRPESDFRHEVLFKDYETTPLWNAIEAEKAYFGALLLRVSDYSEQDVYDFFNSTTNFSIENPEKAKSLANILYFEAKNWAYTQTNHYDELESIQQRIDFSRTTFHIASWALLLTSYAILIFSLLHLLALVSTNFEKAHARKKAEGEEKLRRTIRSDIVTAVILIAVVLGWFEYGNSESVYRSTIFFSLISTLILYIMISIFRYFANGSYLELPENKEYTGILARSGVVIIVVVVMGFFGWLGYGKSEVNFNERAFSYFASDTRFKSINVPPSSRVNFDASLWMVTAGEYEAITKQTYRAAMSVVTRTLCRDYSTDENCASSHHSDVWREGPSGKPYAFVLDLDETLLDNSVYQSSLALTGQIYSDDGWNNWIDVHSQDVGLVPGAKNFVDELERIGVAPVFISNRPDSGREATLRTLTNLGISSREIENRLYLQIDSSNKDARRLHVETQFEVVGLIGDNLGDFEDAFNDLEDFQERLQLTREFDENWGEYWFVLPNPVYGGWKRIIENTSVEDILRPTH